MNVCTKIMESIYLLPSSRFTVAIAATQGVYSSVNTRNANAVSGVSSVFRLSTFPVNTVRVLMTLSLAMNPVINAVDIRQSLIPNGAKTGEKSPPSAARMLPAVSVTGLCPRYKAFCLFINKT